MRILLFISTILFCLTAAFSQTAPLPSKFQSWNEVQLILPLLKGRDVKGKSIDKATVTFNGIVRIGRSNLNLLDRRSDVALDYRFNRYIALLTSVLYRRDTLVRNVPRYETRFDFGAVFSKSWSKFTFRDRNLFEHRLRSGRADINVYRQRIQVGHPINFRKKEIFSPFISEEGNLDLKTRKWILNDFFVGITRRLNSRTSIDIAYIRSDLRPVNVNGLSLSLKIRLR